MGCQLMSILTQIIEDYKFYKSLGYTEEAILDKLDITILYSVYDMERAYDDGYSDGQYSDD